MLNIQNYKKVESIEEAYELNQKKANRIVGGMMWMRMGDNRINTAIDPVITHRICTLVIDKCN